MKKISLMLAMALGLLLWGCAMGPRDRAHSNSQRSDIRENRFQVGMFQKAFVDEWGKPDETFSITTMQFNDVIGLKAGEPGKSDTAPFRKLVMLDVWVYNAQKAIAVFYGIKLVGWRTGAHYRDGLQDSQGGQK
jgi:hypothetical protein